MCFRHSLGSPCGSNPPSKIPIASASRDCPCARLPSSSSPQIDDPQSTQRNLHIPIKTCAIPPTAPANKSLAVCNAPPPSCSCAISLSAASAILQHKHNPHVNGSETQTATPLRRPIGARKQVARDGKGDDTDGGLQSCRKLRKGKKKTKSPSGRCVLEIR